MKYVVAIAFELCFSTRSPEGFSSWGRGWKVDTSACYMYLWLLLSETWVSIRKQFC